MAGKSLLRARAVGVGSATPRQVVTNSDIASMGLDTSDAWINKMTGISQRRVLDSSSQLKGAVFLVATSVTHGSAASISTSGP